MSARDIQKFANYEERLLSRAKATPAFKFRRPKLRNTAKPLDENSLSGSHRAEAPIKRSLYVIPGLAESDEWAAVRSLSDQLFEFMNRHSTLKEFENANQPGASSALVQEVILSVLTDMGFTSEAKGLFADYPTKGLRPDYFKAVGNSGVIVEVERGKTTTNNMDLLDFWKCHICQHANYLFLLVPLALRHNETVKTPKPEYETVRNRLSAFFRPGNYTNVKGLVLFGY